MQLTSERLRMELDQLIAREEAILESLREARRHALGHGRPGRRPRESESAARARADGERRAEAQA